MTFLCKLLLCSLALFYPVSACFSEEVVTPEWVYVFFQTAKLDIKDANGATRTLSQPDGESFKIPILLKRGESFESDPEGVTKIKLPGAGVVRVAPRSTVKLPDTGKDEPAEQKSSLELLKGKLFLHIDGEKLKQDKKQFRIKMPSSILAVRGTEFFAESKQGIDTVGVYAGQVIVKEEKSERLVSLVRGQAVLAKPGALSRTRNLTAEELEEVKYIESLDQFQAERTVAEWLLGKGGTVRIHGKDDTDFVEIENLPRGDWYIDHVLADITNEEFQYLSLLERVRAIHSQPATGEGLYYLKHLPLTQVYFGNLSLEGAEQLGQFPEIRTIEITGGLLDGKVGPEHIRKLSRLPHLRRINFYGRLTGDNETMAELAKFPELDRIDLGSCGLTDASIPEIVKLKNAKHMQLGQNNFTPEGIIQLGEMKWLKMLYIIDPENKDDKVYKKLQGMLSNTIIPMPGN